MHEPKKLACERLSPFHKSASNIIHSAIRLAKMFSMRVAHCTACPHCMQFGAATSVLCLACRCTTPHHLHNANANRAQGHACRSAVPPVQKCQCGCELVGGGEALPDLAQYKHGTVLYGTVMWHCAFSTSLVDYGVVRCVSFHTL